MFLLPTQRRNMRENKKKQARDCIAWLQTPCSAEQTGTSSCLACRTAKSTVWMTMDR